MADEKEIFRTYLKEKRLKWTPQRAEILDEVRSMRGHFEAEGLLARLKGRDSGVSRGSVYRTIKLLEEAKVIRPVVFTERHAHYENIAVKSHHSHLICVKCGKIIEFSRPAIKKELDQACREYGFNEIEHKVEVTGLCKSCR